MAPAVGNGDQCIAEPAHGDGQMPTGAGEKDYVAALRTEIYRAASRSGSSRRRKLEQHALAELGLDPAAGRALTEARQWFKAGLPDDKHLRNALMHFPGATS